MDIVIYNNFLCFSTFYYPVLYKTVLTEKSVGLGMLWNAIKSSEIEEDMFVVQASRMQMHYSTIKSLELVS